MSYEPKKYPFLPQKFVSQNTLVTLQKGKAQGDPQLFIFVPEADLCPTHQSEIQPLLNYVDSRGRGDTSSPPPSLSGEGLLLRSKGNPRRTIKIVTYFNISILYFSFQIKSSTLTRARGLICTKIQERIKGPKPPYVGFHGFPTFLFETYCNFHIYQHKNYLDEKTELSQP